MPNKALNSILTKIRARQGKMLTESDFKAMSSLADVSEISAYLRARTKFASALSKINDTSVHRNYLEKVLRRAQHDDIESICRFERSVGDDLYSYIVRREEADALMGFIRCLSAGRPEKYILDMSYSLDSYSKLDFMALANIKTFDDLRDFLSGTDFSAISLTFPINGEAPDITLIETALDRVLYETAFRNIDRYGDADTRKKLRELFLMQAELTDCAVIYRGKKYYNASENTLRPDLIGYRYLLPQVSADKMLRAETSDEVIHVIKDSKYKKYIEKYGGFSDSENFMEKLLFSKISGNIHFSSSPPVVMMSYYFLLGTELNNLIKIIEGVRYGVAPEEIMKTIITKKEV